MKKTYIGDAIYAEVVDDCDQVVIYTSDGAKQQATIYLEPETWTALKTYINRHTKW